MKQGDVLYSLLDSEQFNAVKLLEIDVCETGGETFHCIFYQLLNEKPTLENRDKLQVMSWHGPIDGSDFRENWQVLCSEEISKEELQGFYCNLKLTNFSRYLKVTNQDQDAIIASANQCYKTALALTDQGDIDQAIEKYSQAIELFPLFFEAIDNRAFLFMDKGEYQQALPQFEDSLQVNPHGMHAMFARGECLLELKMYSQAEEAFQQCIAKFPDQKASFKSFLKRATIGRKAHPENGNQADAQLSNSSSVQGNKKP